MPMILAVIIGTTLISIGLLLLVLPGPGILFILGGLAVLAPHFKFAQRTMDFLKAKFKTAREYFEARKQR